MYAKAKIIDQSEAGGFLLITPCSAIMSAMFFLFFFVLKQRGKRTAGSIPDVIIPDVMIPDVMIPDVMIPDVIIPDVMNEYTR